MYTCKLNCGQPRFTFIQNEYAGNTNNTDHVDAPKHLCTYMYTGWGGQQFCCLWLTYHNDNSN